MTTILIPIINSVPGIPYDVVLENAAVKLYVLPYVGICKTDTGVSYSVSVLL